MRIRRVIAALVAASAIVGAALLPRDSPATADVQLDARMLLTALPTRVETPVAAVLGFSADGGTCSLTSRVLLQQGSGVRMQGCRVVSGTWRTSWSAQVVRRPVDATALHVVTPREALRSGAATWSGEQRTAFANDVSGGALAAVPGALAAQRAGRQPGAWAPSTGRCDYAARWIAVKTRWRLAVDSAERSALERLLAGCASTAVEAPAVVSRYRYLPVGDTRHWRQVIAEDFQREAPVGTFPKAYPGWSAYDGGRDSSKTLGRAAHQQGEYRNDRTVAVHDGRLTCDLRTEGSQPQLCAVIPALSDGSRPAQQYGRYVVRFRTDRIPGYKIAWLLWPADDDWRKGEIDFPEAELDARIWAATHRVDGDPSKNAAIFDTGRAPTSWHTAAIEWTPGRIVFDLDGRRWSTTDSKGLPQTPMMWALQAESRLSASAPDTTARGRITLDWLTAYQYRA